MTTEVSGCSRWFHPTQNPQRLKYLYTDQLQFQFHLYNHVGQKIPMQQASLPMIDQVLNIACIVLNNKLQSNDPDVPALKKLIASVNPALVLIYFSEITWVHSLMSVKPQSHY